jgi:hypothetical protein
MAKLITIVLLGIGLLVANVGLPREDVVRTRIPVAAKSDTGTCVNLILPAGAIGFIPIYCFDESNRLVYQGKY